MAVNWDDFTPIEAPEKAEVNWDDFTPVEKPLDGEKPARIDLRQQERQKAAERQSTLRAQEQAVKAPPPDPNLLKMPGSVLNGAKAPPLDTGAVATQGVPYTREFLTRVQRQMDAATPEKRAEIAARTDTLGRAAQEVMRQYAAMDKAAAPIEQNVGVTPAVRTLDTRREARSGRLARGGFDPEMIKPQATANAVIGLGDSAGTVAEIPDDPTIDAIRNSELLNQNALARGIAKGAAGLGTSLAGFGQWLADNNGDFGMGQSAQAMRSRFGAISDAVGADRGARISADVTQAKDSGARWIESGIENAVSSIIRQAPGLATGRSASALTQMFIDTFGQEYGDARAAGKNTNDAFKRAAIFGGFEVAGEKLGLDYMMPRLKNMAKGVDTDKLPEFFAGMLKREVPGELFTHAGESITDASSIGLRQDMTFAQYLSEIPQVIRDTVLQTGMMAGAGAGVGAATLAARNRYGPIDANPDNLNAYLRSTQPTFHMEQGQPAPAVVPPDAYPQRPDTSEWDAFLAGEQSDQAFRLRELQQQQQKQRELDAIATQSREDLGLTPAQQAARAAAATDEEPTAMELALRKAGVRPMPGTVGDLQSILNDPRPLEEIQREQAGQAQQADQQHAAQAQGTKRAISDTARRLANIGNSNHQFTETLAPTLIDENGNPRFATHPIIREFKRATGLGQDAVHAIQRAQMDGNPITLEEARAAENAARESRRKSFEYEMSPEKRAEDARNLKERETEKQRERENEVLSGQKIEEGDYQFADDDEDGAVYRVKNGLVLLLQADGSWSPSGDLRRGNVDDDGVWFARRVRNLEIVKRASTVGDGTREAPVQVQAPAHVEQAEAQVDTQPTDGQKEAGNYRMGHITVQGLPITIENPKGSVRSGTDKTGRTWSNTIHHTYGYIKGVEAKDGDKLDVFVGPNPASGTVFVIDQIDPGTGKYDEAKVMLGFDSADEARRGYLANYDQGWSGLGAMTPMSIDEFKVWIKGGKTHRPVAYAPSEPTSRAQTPAPATPRPATAQPEPGAAGRTTNPDVAPGESAQQPTKEPSHGQGQETPEVLNQAVAGEQPAAALDNLIVALIHAKGTVHNRDAVDRAVERAKLLRGRSATPADLTYLTRLQRALDHAKDKTAAGIVGDIIAEVRTIPNPGAGGVARKARPVETLLQAIKARGGIRIDLAQELTGEPPFRANRRFPGLFTRNGKGLDILAHDLAVEDGFDIHINLQSENDTGGVRKLEELIGRMLGGETIYNERGMERARESEYRDGILEQARNGGITTRGRPFAQVEAEVIAAQEKAIASREAELEEEALVAYNDVCDRLRAATEDFEFDDLLHDVSVRFEDETQLNYLLKATTELQRILDEKLQRPGEPETLAQQDAGGGAPLGGGQDRPGADEKAGRPDFALQGQTEADLAEQDRQQQAAEARQQEEERKAAEAERKAREDAEIAARQNVGGEFFTLDAQVNDKTAQKKADAKRAEDQLAGQVDIFGQTPAPPAEPKKQEIPNAVRDRVTTALDRLREFAQSIEDAKSLEDRVGQRGRYQADTWTNGKAQLDAARKTLDTFRTMAKEKGVDADAYLETLGGVPDLTPSKEAQEWLDAPGRGGVEDGAAKDGKPKIQEHKIGDALTIMGRSVILAKQKTIAGVRYELFNDAKLKDTGGATRVIDVDSGNVVSLRTYDDYSEAEAAYEEATPRGGKDAVQPGPAWHTTLPVEGLPPFKDQSRNYAAVPLKIAGEAYDAIRRDQLVAGMKMYAYVMPAANGLNGIVRLLPEDQTPPKPWKLLDGEGLRVSGMTRDQVVARIGEWLRREPILADEKATPKMGAEEQKPATDFSPLAKDVGGRIAWTDGTIALIEGYSVLNGEPVYIGAKGGQRTRVDIQSFTGNTFTAEEKAALLKARAEAVAQAAEELRKNPNGPFSAGPVVISDDIPEKVAGVAREWIRLLGLDDARIVITTPAAGAEMAKGLFGRFRRIGKANLSGQDTNGIMQPLGDNDYHIALRPGLSVLHTLEALAHELGHIVEKRAFAATKQAFRDEIRAEHEKWLKANGGGRAVDLALAMRAYRSGTRMANTEVGADQVSPYWKSFGEWFADQVSRWATTTAKPMTAVERYFKRLADRLATFFRGERAKFLPNAKVAEWLDSLSPQIGGEEDAAPPAASVRQIQDFGEKIGGARKDVWTSFKDQLSDVSDDDIANQPLSKIWPQPDYQALLDGGADPWAVAFAHAARDEIPAKPRSPWKVKGWTEKVTLLRDTTLKLMDGRLSVERAKQAMPNFMTKGMQDLAGRVELYLLVGHSQSLEGVRIRSGEYSVHNGIEYNPPKTIWTVEKDTAATAFSNWPRELAVGATKEEALQAFKEKYGSLDINPPASKETTFEIYSKHGERGYWIGKKIGRNPLLLEGPFDNIKEARKYKADHQAELVAKLEKAKEIPRERRDTNEPRVGVDMRNGQDVTPQMFGEAFGFRGVEFGNWVEQGRRQKDLNDAFDALMDMAAIIGVPPKALSLNGELGLAFGARGTGGVHAASAHYESGKVTKRSGAGSLGHEWWHAVDNYFARMRQSGDGMMTGALDVSLVSRGSPYHHQGAVRKEMIEAFGAVMKAIRETAMKARSNKLDAKRSKDYWTTDPEMSARAFESYLISKLQDQGASNDYLANIVSPETWKAAESMGFELDDSYPYPTAGEIPAIRAGFDHFFRTVQTRETDKGVAMLSRSGLNDYNEANGILEDTAGHRTIDWAELTALRREAAGLERPEAGKFLTVTEDGRAIATGEPRTRIPDSFARFAEKHGLKFEARRRISGDTRHTYAGYSGRLPIEYRESGAMYFGEMGESFVDRTGKSRFSRSGSAADFALERLGDALINHEAQIVIGEEIPSVSVPNVRAAQLFSASGELEGNAAVVFRDGRIPMLVDIRMVHERAGLGEKYVRAMAASMGESGLMLYDIQKPAEGFWTKMGTTPENLGGELAHGNGFLFWSDYSQARVSQVHAARPAQDSASRSEHAEGGEYFLGRREAPLERGHDGRIHAEDLSAVAAEFRQVFPGLPIQTADSEAQLPKQLRQAIKDLGAQGDTAAAFHDGAVWLVRSGIHSLRHARRIVPHEATHAGLDWLLGQAKDRLLLDINRQNAAVAEKAKDIAARYRYSMVRATEEVLSDMGPKVKALKGWNKLVAWVRRQFRKLGWVQEWTDRDVEDLVLQALERAKKGPRAPFGVSRMSAFSRADTIEVDGISRARLNSEGRPIALTDEALKNFWRWFGGSKVVDAEGRPLVVYHGTAQSFDTFDKGKLGENTGARSATKGFFASADPVTASSPFYTGFPFDLYQSAYLGRRFKVAADRLGYSHLVENKPYGPWIQDWRIRGKVNAVALDIAIEEMELPGKLREEAQKIDPRQFLGRSNNVDAESKSKANDLRKKARELDAANEYETQARIVALNKYAADEDGNRRFDSDSVAPVVMPLYISIKAPFVKDYGGESYRDISYADIINAAINDGHDGVILMATTDGGPETNIYVAFRPEQIKSAISNTGEFSAADPDIRLSRTSQAIDLAAGITPERSGGKVVVMTDKGAGAPSADKLPSPADAEPKHVVAARQILDAIENDGYFDYGLRVLDKNDAVSVGDILPPSRNWEDGSPTEELLMGTSSAGVQDLSIDGIVRALDNLGAIGKTGPNGYYIGDRVALLEGEVKGYGSDVGEHIIKNARVVGIWKKEGDGPHTVIPNEHSAPDSVGATHDRPGAAQGGANDAMLSRTSQAIDLAADVLDTITQPSAKSFGMLKGMQTQLHKARTVPAYGRAFRLAMAFRNDLSRAAFRPWESAKDILPAYDDLKGAWQAILHGKKSSADITAAGRFLFDGTMYGGGNPLAGLVYSDAKLKSLGATDEQIRLYRQAREAIDASLDEVTAAVAWKLAKRYLHPAAKYIAINDPAQARDTFLDMLETARRAAEDEVGYPDQQTAQAAEKAIRGTIEAVTDTFDHAEALKAAGYAPLMRFGRYTLDVVETDPLTGKKDRLGFRKFETETEAKFAEKEARRAYAGNPNVIVTRGVQSENSLFQGVDPETVALFAKQIAKIPGLDIDKAVLDEYYRSAVSERSALVRTIKRKGIAGYSEDLPRVLASFLTSNARYASSTWHMGDLREAIQDLRDQKVHGDIADEAQALYDYINGTQEPGAWMRGLMFAWYLGGSPAAAAINLTQPVLMTYPYLAQFGPARAAKALADATVPAVRDAAVPAGLRAALRRAQEEGVVEAQEIHHLYQEGMRPIISKLPGGDSLRARAQGAAAVWGALFGMAENFNRRLTFIAAYKMASTDPSLRQRFGSAYEFARRAVEETQGIYAKENRPNWARGTGPLGAVGVAAFTFKQYSIQYVELVARMWQSGPEGKMAAGLMLGLLMLASGLKGLPFADDLKDLVDTILQRLGYQGNAEKAIRDELKSLAGERMADLVLYGLSAETPIDVQGRLGLGNMLPATGIFKPSETNKASQVAELFGPPGGMARQIGDFADAIEAGKDADAFKAFSPKMVQDVTKGWQMWKTGEYRDSRNRKVTEVSMGDAAIKAIGFQPQAVAEKARRDRLVQQDVTRVRGVESNIVGLWVEGIIDKDVSKVAKAREMMRDWNQRNPETKIRVTPEQVQQRVKQAKMDREQRMLKAAPREMRGYVAEGTR